MKRIIFILTIVATTLALAGSAMAEPPSTEELAASMGFYEDPAAPGCYFSFGTMYVCAPSDGVSPTSAQIQYAAE